MKPGEKDGIEKFMRMQRGDPKTKQMVASLQFGASRQSNCKQKDVSEKKVVKRRRIQEKWCQGENLRMV